MARPAQADIRQMTQPFSQILRLAPNAISDIADFLQNSRSEATVRTGRNNAAIFSFKDDNFISRSLVPDKSIDYKATAEYKDGKKVYGDALLTIDYSKLKDEIAPKLFQTKPSLAAPFIDELQANRISFYALETKSPSGAPQTYILVGKEDYASASKIMDDLNHYRYYAQAMTPIELHAYGRDKEYARVEKLDELTYNQLKKDHLLNFPHTVTTYIKGDRKLYDITCVEVDKEKLEKAVRLSTIYLSGKTRDLVTEYNNTRNEKLENSFKALADNAKSRIVFDERHPDRFVRSRGETVTIYRIGTDGREESFGTIHKDDSAWHVQLNKELRSYASPRVVDGDIDIKKELERVSHDRSLLRRSVPEQMMYFKHEISRPINEMMEHEWYKDNIIKLGNAKDHAVINKDDNTARDLEGDIALNNRVSGGSRGIVDYSDIGDSYANVPRETQAQEYMEKIFKEVLGTGHLSKEECEQKENEYSEMAVFQKLSHAKPEIQEMLKEDLLDSMRAAAPAEFTETLIREDFEEELSEGIEHSRVIEEQEYEFDL